MNEETNFLFWFAAVKHSTVPEYKKKLEQYLDISAAYIIGMETAKGVHHATNGEHIHIAAQISKETYKKFHLNYHVGQLKLVMKTKDGIAKQNGLIKTVRNETRFLAYTCKDNNIIYRNIDLKTIQQYIEESFPKVETWENDIIEYLKLTYDATCLSTELHDWHNCQPDNHNKDKLALDCANCTKDLEEIIVSYYIANSKKKSVPARTTIRKIVSRFLMYEIPEYKGPHLTHIILNYITMKVIASVEKYENAGMKFRTVPAFALAESRASDACCLFLTVHTLTRSQRVFLPRKVPSKLRILDQIWNCTRGERTASTHELRPVLFPCASCRPPPMQPCCDACFLSPC